MAFTLVSLSSCAVLEVVSCLLHLPWVRVWEGCREQIIRTGPAQLLFLNCLTQVPLVMVSCPSPKTPALPCLQLGIKDSLKEDVGLLTFGFLEGEGFLDIEGFWKRGLLEGDC
jgi:hypothetical protein